MEIVHVSAHYPPRVGGEALVTRRLAAIQAKTTDVTVYTCGFRGAPTMERDGRLRVVRERTRWFGDPPIAPSLLVRLLRHSPRPDLVHVHTDNPAICEIVRFAMATRGIPYLAQPRRFDPAPRGLRQALPVPLYRRTRYPRYLREAALVICQTEVMRDEANARYGVPEDRLAVIPDGVDVDVFRPPVPGERSNRELLIVSRLAADQNLLLAVEAMAALPSDLILRIVGTGDLAGRIQRRAAELKLTNIRLAGELSSPELAASYRRAAAVLLPATRGALPLVLLEAMASGTPVICPARADLLPAAGAAVVPVEPFTPGQLAAAIRDLLADQARRERLSRAARRNSYLHTWPAIADLVADGYRLVLASARDATNTRDTRDAS